MRWNPEPALVRLWQRVDKSGDCWLWLGGTATKGHGQIRDDGGRLEQVHRLTWAEAHGPIPDGHDVHHVCEVKTCVRPSHLMLLEHGEHARRHILAKQTCKFGHPLDIVVAASHTRSGTQRGCSICRRDRMSRFLARKAQS